MNSLVKKFIVMFLIALFVFSISASVIGTALLIGKGEGYVSSDNANRGEEPVGESFNVLLIMTDFDPEMFSDYDPETVKKIFGDEYESRISPTGLSKYRKITAESMAILRFDKERCQLTYTHIPGNTYVSAKGVKLFLGDLISEYGVEFLLSKVKAITGIEIDSYFVFTPQSAALAFDRVGEVTYTIQCDMKYKNVEKGIDINLKSGSQRLNGQKTVEMLRFDEYAGMGVTRASTVCGYLKRFTSKLSSDHTYGEIRNIIDELMNYKNLSTNFTFEDSEETVRLLADAEKLTVTELSLIGNSQTIDGEKYFILDEEKTLEKLEPYRKINTPDNIWK